MKSAISCAYTSYFPEKKLDVFVMWFRYMVAGQII